MRLVIEIVFKWRKNVDLVKDKCKVEFVKDLFILKSVSLFFFLLLFFNKLYEGDIERWYFKMDKVDFKCIGY